MSDTIDAEDSKLFELKKKVAKRRVALNENIKQKEEEEKGSSPQESKELIALRAEVKALQERSRNERKKSADEDSGKENDQMKGGKREKNEEKEKDTKSNDNERLNTVTEETKITTITKTTAKDADKIEHREYKAWTDEEKKEVEDHKATNENKQKAGKAEEGIRISWVARSQ